MSVHEFLMELGLDMEFHGRIMASIGSQYEKAVLSQANRPAGMAYFDGVIHAAHGERVREIAAAREKGAKFIGTFCIYVPEEIVFALGAVPLALCGGTAMSIPHAEKTFPRDICPLVKSTLGLAMSNTCPYAPIEDLAVGETTCDAKKKTWDVLSRDNGFHVMEIPQKKGPLGRALWMSEIRVFAARLEALTGNTLEPDNLAAAIRMMNDKRRALASLHGFRKEADPPISGLDVLAVTQAGLIDEPRRFTANLEALNDELAGRVKSGRGVANGRSHRILVAGCPSVMGNWKLHRLLESSGAVVVCDETCTGTRYFSNPVDERDGSLDAQLDALADRYLKVDCSCFTPNAERLANVVRLAREFKADGVIQYILQYCHTYNVEAINIAAVLGEAGVPSLKIVTDYSEEDAGQLRTRIEAFLEGLENR